MNDFSRVLRSLYGLKKVYKKVEFAASAPDSGGTSWCETPDLLQTWGRGALFIRILRTRLCNTLQISWTYESRLSARSGGKGSPGGEPSPDGAKGKEPGACDNEEHQAIRLRHRGVVSAVGAAVHSSVVIAVIAAILTAPP